MSFFNSFSQRARRAVFWANSRAVQEDASEITAEHILYGVLQEDPQLFALLAPENPKLASQIEESLVANGEVSKPRARTEVLRLSEPAKEIIRIAVREKERLKHRAVGTQHLLLAVLIYPEKRKPLFRRTKPSGIAPATQFLKKHGVLAETVEAATKAGIVTSQAVALDDPLLKLNAQLSALAELLTAKGVFTRHEFVALLDQNEGPVTPEVFLSPLIDALIRKGKLTENEKSKLIVGHAPGVSGDKAPD
jgi:ATP-dependent Clp protease ATP-binding subunit ClpA